jgi:hypothetical protein
LPEYVTVGGVVSILTVAVCVVSTSPKLSVEEYSTVCVPSPVTRNGPV